MFLECAIVLGYFWNYKVIFYMLYLFWTNLGMLHCFINRHLTITAKKKKDSAVFCTGNCHWSGNVLVGYPGTIWMDPVPLRGLQEARIVDGWIASELSSFQDDDHVPLQRPEMWNLFFCLFVCFTCVLLPPWQLDSMLWNLITQHLWMIVLLRSRLQNKFNKF